MGFQDNSNGLFLSELNLASHNLGQVKVMQILI